MRHCRPETVHDLVPFDRSALLNDHSPGKDSSPLPKEAANLYKCLSVTTRSLLLLWPTPETVSVTKQRAFRLSVSVSGVAQLKHGSIQTLTSSSQTVSLKSKAAA